MFNSRQAGLDHHLQQIKDRDDIINKIFVVSFPIILNRKAQPSME